MDTFLAVSKWVDDSVPFPGKAFRQWIRDFYQKNKLVKGELELRGATGGPLRYRVLRPERRGGEGLHLSSTPGRANDGPDR